MSFGRVGCQVATPVSRRRRPAGLTTTAAFLRNGRLRILALGQAALYAPVFDDPQRPVNLASRGEQNRHRLSRRGNRQLNAAIHVVAVSQARDAGPGQQHYRRKLAEAKTPNEARRSLKRRLSNIIYRRLLADQKAAKRARA